MLTLWPPLAPLAIATALGNAAPEWQARSIGWRSKKLAVACPLEGLVRSVASSQEMTAALSLTSNTYPYTSSGGKKI